MALHSTVAEQPAAPFCQEKADGMYADPADPADFIHCTHGAAFNLHCNRDLVWDSSCNCCNLPHSTQQTEGDQPNSSLPELEPASSSSHTVPEPFERPEADLNGPA
ncbi:hypothetical protein WJX84_007098 [Apatococcus fuscideae]|uniref:Chitin-binding type-2 domain-containing protein n=1 Tax=Apatococcus fuscideae TaxID=2026836 RepID=A0AAW1T2E0_9CHLO